MLDVYRLRVELPDRPGSLARLASLLAAHGGNVMSLDIHVVDHDRAVDEIVAGVPDSFDPLSFGADLRAEGVGVLLSCLPAPGTIDRVARALGWATALVQSGLGYDDLELARTVAEISGADVAWIGSATDALTHEAGRRALAQQRPHVEHTLELPTPLRINGSSAGWLMVVADVPDDAAVVAFAARGGDHSFTATETVRVQALLRLHRELVGCRLAR